jgi:2-oxoglutarate ferredoxin oxidoreductase subunit gamma
MQSDGVLVVNSSLAHYEPAQMASPEKSQKKIQVFEVPASQIAERLGTVRVANLVALGGYIGVTRLVSKASIEAALTRNIPDSRTDLRSLNATAFQEGLDLINVSGDNRR